MIQKKIRIAIFIPSLTAGGAERIMSFIAQKLNKNIFSVTLVVTGSEKETKYEVNDVDVIFFNKSRVLYSIPAIIGYLRKSDTHIAFSAIRHLNVVMGLISILFPKIKFVAREVNVMSKLQEYPEQKTRKYPSFITKKSFSQLDAIICQSQDMLKDIQSEHIKLKSKFHVINNPITDSFETKKNKTSLNSTYKLITVGSLELRKGHARILKGLVNLDVDFQYTIIGSGSQKNNIDTLIERLNIQDKVIYVPYTDNVSNYLKDSHIFIQGSYVEGFPNALLESCAVGTPVIAFNAPGGINEIVENNVNGYIVNDGNELLSAIKKIIDSPDFKPDKVSESVFKKYNSKVILGKYQDFFLQLVEL